MQGRSHTHKVQTYLRHRAEVHNAARTASLRQKKAIATSYNKGINIAVHHLGDLAIPYQKHSGKLQLGGGTHSESIATEDLILVHSS